MKHSVEEIYWFDDDAGFLNRIAAICKLRSVDLGREFNCCTSSGILPLPIQGLLPLPLILGFHPGFTGGMRQCKESMKFPLLMMSKSTSKSLK